MLSGCEERDAEPLVGGKFGRCVVFAADPSPPGGAAAPGEVGQAVQRGARTAEMMEQ